MDRSDLFDIKRNHPEIIVGKTKTGPKLVIGISRATRVNSSAEPFENILGFSLGQTVGKFINENEYEKVHPFKRPASYFLRNMPSPTLVK